MATGSVIAEHHALNTARSRAAQQAWRAGLRCPVCLGWRTRNFCATDEREYRRCETCAATFLPPRFLPDSATELSHYRLHINDPDDAGYRAFLNRLAQPLLARLPPHQSGLDFGCGPGPVLAAMLRAAGHQVALYDPYFQPDRSTLQRTYDFVTCTETAEHFHRPAEEFSRLRRLLRPGGCLAVMTQFLIDDCRFATWHYRRDPTHVVFYRHETFRWLACRHGLECEFPAENVVLLRHCETF